MEYHSEIVIIMEEDEKAVRDYCAELKVEVKRVAVIGLEPIGTITLVIVGTVTVVGLVERFVDRLQGGQVIDLRPNADRMLYRTKDLTYGYVLILTHDGKVEIKTLETKGILGQTLETIRDIALGMPSKPAAEVAGAITAATGQIATVHDSDTPT